jgi:hypothetical protein
MRFSKRQQFSLGLRIASLQLAHHFSKSPILFSGEIFKETRHPLQKFVFSVVGFELFGLEHSTEGLILLSQAIDFGGGSVCGEAVGFRYCLSIVIEALL